jgi:phospholipase/carboxylesterase
VNLSRRRFIDVLAAGAGGLIAGRTLTGCSLSTDPQAGGGSARLTARPGAVTGAVSPGLIELGLGTQEGYLYVPASYVAGRPTPFLLSFHGAGISAQGPINLMSSYAEARGFLLLSVDSRSSTWDALQVGQYGLDVTFIDTALRTAFSRCSADPAKVYLSGFSDGASYALGIGLANGDLFSRVVAFSPGFIPGSDTPASGHPEFFLSHGTLDAVLPIDRASRLIVPFLRSAGYDVTYDEFVGEHSVPPDVALAAVNWFLR